MQYHPHGDASIADALVVLQQKRYLIEGQGNFGNIYTGDPAAASRYIECRLTDLARNEIFNDKITPDRSPATTAAIKEPVTLPVEAAATADARRGGHRGGIEHAGCCRTTFNELIEARDRHSPRQSRSTLLPDFPQGGIMDASGYAKGTGKIKLRAVIEPKAASRRARSSSANSPPERPPTTLIASIEDAARKKKIRIKSIDDFTAEHGRGRDQAHAPGEDVKKTIAALYLFTDCEQSHFSVRPIVIRVRPTGGDGCG